MPVTQHTPGLQTAVLNRIDDAMEQLDRLTGLAEQLRIAELRIIAEQSFGMLERYKDSQRPRKGPSFVCERCKDAFPGDGRYYPGSSIANQPPMQRVCEPCERALLDANGLALQARFHAVVASVPAPTPKTIVTSLGYEMVARAEKARTMAKVLVQGGVPSSDAARMIADDWGRFAAGLKAKGILGPYSTVPSAETIAATLLEMRKLQPLAPRPAKIRRRVAA